MKQLYLLISLLFACGNLFTQNIVKYEYWLNNDYAAKVQTNISPTPVFNGQTTLSFQQLEEGIYTLSFRFMDAGGKWSSTHSSSFYRIINKEITDNAIRAYEYWLDDDYAGRVQTSLAAASVADVALNISFNALNEGIHRFNIRFKDQYGKWSSTHSSTFYRIVDKEITDNVTTAYEYWLDDNYAGRVETSLAAASTVNVSLDVPLNEIGAGIHRFDIRFKDKYGKWSSVDSKYFIKKAPSPADNSLTDYEYWMNDDYDERYTGVIDRQATFVFFDSIDTRKANRVLNAVHFRYKDERGLWSATASTFFYRPVAVSFYLTYTPSVPAGTTPVIESGYDNYRDIAYEAYNITQDKEINIGFKYPDIALNDSVGVGDKIAITLTSFSKDFKTVRDTIIIAEDNVITDTLNIVQNGLIRANYSNSENDANVGIVYDASGARVAQFDYIGQTLTTQALPDGNYTLVSMANSPFFNTIQHLQDFASTEMVANIDYTLQSLAVKTGVITETSVTIPKLDEDRLYYTGSNTSFSVNKSQITIGNYATLRAEIDFKEQHLPNISNVKLVVDLPEKSPFVNNSLMVGTAVSNGYSLSNNRLTVPLSNYSDVVRFCVSPTAWGSFELNAFLEFTLDGKTIRQPIGFVRFVAENLSIFAPECTAQTTIPVQGLAPAKSLIKVYDNEVLVGQTTANSNGFWLTWCALHEPGEYSLHAIYAEVFTTEGTALRTETIEVIYNVDAIEVSRVTMYNTAHAASSLALEEFVTVADFLNPPSKAAVYWYWPAYADFTFAIELTREHYLISEVWLKVLKSSGNSVEIPASYDAVKNKWIAKGHFPYGNDLPVNVSVKYALYVIDVKSCSGRYKFSDNLNFKPVQDPSGYVYEAVPSNRLEGVTASVYQKTWVENIYGDPIETITLWDAEDYGQVNPQQTNQYGEYAWDVPQGEWQIKYEKAGYETVYSAWLPVPPPQLDINVAMVQAIPPQVKNAKGYETGIEILFDKFMLPATLTTDLITVTRNGIDVTGTITLLNAEINPANTAEQFVSKVRFVPEAPFSSAEEIILTVKRAVQSYAGNEMENDFVQRIEIQKEVTSIAVTPVLDVSLHGSAYLEVSAELGEAAAGKKVTARSVSSAIASVANEVILDADGKGKLPVNGEMLGTTVIVVSLENTDLKAEALIHVTATAITEQVETPVASLPSGSVVAENTAVTLSSSTAAAAIFYTLDNTPPSATNGLAYSQPIVITESVVIRAIAVKEG
ncbi:MAG: chitobiase/beta-hexosaminidase C-terminal domain-containing protein, partial [Candidatus Symbiothrix sp.]|nr:chitobiase/beta-hexosaminidase C-terminal domain-containing protein [Candidatus Symbiothrix sp.]